MRKHLPGIASATKTLADGTRRQYYYAWRGGPMLRSPDGAPLQPADPRFHVAYVDLHRKRKSAPPGTLASLVALFRAAPELTTKAKKTQVSYRYYLKLIEAKFGKIPLDVAQNPKMRGDFKAWRDSMAQQPRKADYAWMVLARMLSIAKDRGIITVNVCERGGRLYDVDRTETVWTAGDIKAFCGVASESLQSALLLALWTGQRRGDLLKLTWRDYDGQALRLRQSKTGKRVTIPVGSTLKPLLDAALEAHKAAVERHGNVVPMTILINSRGLPWTGDGFHASWAKSFAKTGLAELHFHDLRGTAVTRLALSGCSVPEIAAITGHSLRDVEVILDAHYMGGRVELAESAIGKLNAAYG